MERDLAGVWKTVRVMVERVKLRFEWQETICRCVVVEEKVDGELTSGWM